METEKLRPSRRKRKGSRRSSQLQQPPENMPVDDPVASAPSEDIKTAIARSKSRYKAARPKPPRSLSAPFAPAVQSFDNSVNDSPGKGKTRPNTTLNGFPNVSAIDHEDEPLIKLIQGNNGAPYSRGQVRNPEAPQRARLIHDNQELPRHLPRKSDSTITPEERCSTNPRRPHSQERPRPSVPSSHHTSANQGGPRQAPFVAEQEKRRMVLPTRPAVLPRKSFTQRMAGFVNQPRSAADAKEQFKQMISHPIPVADGVPLPVPQFDAPKSAINAGERTVKVKYGEYQVPVSIFQSTTPVDVIRSVSEKVAKPLDPASSVILESYKQLGLERPLRRYEHIRDVLNSWDSVSQNILIIEPSVSGGYDDDLDIKHVPKKRPDDSSFSLYHSQSPDHWDKREVRLRSDGQMLIAKSRGAEATNICHISDFDIYIPTARQMAKRIRPPRKICFAVKSQQKSNMFMSTINYIHFFSTNDKKVAKALYTAVQEWRSWYLVNTMGKGADLSHGPIEAGQNQATRKMIDESSPRDFALPTSGTASGRIDPLKSSMDTNNGVAKDRAQGSASFASQPFYPNTTSQGPRERQAPAPTLVPRSSTTDAPAEAPFADNGLLGRKYTHRKKTQQGSEQMKEHPIAWPASSPSPIKSSANELKRTSSQLKKPKPLVDLTPQYQEPPQHLRKGRGVTPGQIPQGGLVDIATSPEVAIPIPPTTSWRRPGTSSGPEISPSRNRP